MKNQRIPLLTMIVAGLITIWFLLGIQVTTQTTEFPDSTECTVIQQARIDFNNDMQGFHITLTHHVYEDCSQSYSIGW